MIERIFENIKYGSYLQNSDFNDLFIKYKQIVLTRQPIDSLTYNSEERLKVDPIERPLDNIRYKSNPWYANFDYLSFDGD